MKKLHLALIILFILTFCWIYNTRLATADTQTIYHNADGHFSFAMPDGWIEIPKNEIDEVVSTLQGQSKNPNSIQINADAALQKESDRYFSYPYLIISITQDNTLTEYDLKNMYNDKQSTQNEINDTENNYSFLSNLKEGATYDSKRHILFISVSSNVVGVGNVQGITATKLSNYGAVTLSFYDTANNYNNDLIYFTSILDSFKLDEGYEYQNSFMSNIPKYWRNIIYFGIIGLLYGVFSSFFRRKKALNNVNLNNMQSQVAVDMPLVSPPDPKTEITDIALSRFMDEVQRKVVVGAPPVPSEPPPEITDSTNKVNVKRITGVSKGKSTTSLDN